ncbi:PepSY-like domain-containing protein [Bacteroides sp.]
MKVKIYSVLIALLCAVGLQSCDSDDDHVVVPVELQKAFSEKYPSATRVEWEVEYGYYVADFYDNSYGASAWFSPDGKWYMTETDVPYAALPEVVKLAFEQGEYSAWTVDDVDKLEREGMETVYVIEVEMKSQGMEMDLYYSVEGMLIKAVADTDDDTEGYLPPAQTPEAILAFINEKYPDARLVETEVEHGRTEVEIIHEGYCKEVIFDSNGNWVSTSWDIRRNELPTVVTQALAGSQYSAYTIDDVEYFETPGGDYYLLELEQRAKEVKVKIDTTGKFI